MQTMPPLSSPPASGARDSATAAALCLGETMVMLGADEGSLSESAVARLYVAGAESNVATGIAHLGHHVEWFSRLGDDPFGERIRSSLGNRGVDTRRVIVDPDHGTGIYFKDWSSGESSVYYYRSDSAAAQLSLADFAGLELSTRRLCHLSGITPALSPSCDAAMGELLLTRERGDTVISFDVNHRAQLWSAEVAAPRMLELARGADIVIVGRDEAETLWGTATAEAIRELFADAPLLVVKDSDIGATSFIGSESYFVPALRVEVVEPIGAGDAFAAGFLSAWLDDEDPVSCLRLGHVMAAHVLRSLGDTPQLPPRAELLALARLDERSWRDLHLTRPRVDAVSPDRTSPLLVSEGIAL
ncbi:sugar kinase [Glaciibacter psychrotolerans]|uniref:2-dehydro-3-deoxygluconokinase n=1 Tax=Glaciibacter psychrotolerans TaxID=670054 RepID=A0A7Z0EGM4_9MICO|nr:sugar kinase [Leifsonia psychrotolerans]NYJ21294.1 2-dehydro-3-deoxygluconokinase [Leifsonia psychrotolerans]